MRNHPVIKALIMIAATSCLFASFAFAYEDFSNARINSSDDIWDLLDNGEISYEYAQFLLELYDNPLDITPDAREYLQNLSILSPQEIRKFPLSPSATGEESPLADALETIKPFFKQNPGQDNKLRLTYSSYQQGQTSESMRLSLNPETQLYLWGKDMQSGSLSKYCLKFYDCSLGYYFLRFGEGLVLNNGSRQTGKGAFHDSLWRKSRVMRGAYLTKQFQTDDRGAAASLFFSDVSPQPYTLSLKGFDQERIIGGYVEWQIKRLSLGCTGYTSRLENQAARTTYSVIGPHLLIDLPDLQISGESAWYSGTNTSGCGWIVRVERDGDNYSLRCRVYDLSQGFCSPYGHVSGIEDLQDASDRGSPSGGSVCISRFFKGRLSSIRVSYDYSNESPSNLWLLACYNPSKRIKTKWWIENTNGQKTACSGKIKWDITSGLDAVLGVRHEEDDNDRNAGHAFLESNYSPYQTTNIKAKIKFQNNMTRDDYREYSLQLVQQLLKQHVKFIGRYTAKEYEDNTRDYRTNLELETMW